MQPLDRMPNSPRSLQRFAQFPSVCFWQLEMYRVHAKGEHLLIDTHVTESISCRAQFDTANSGDNSNASGTKLESGLNINRTLAESTNLLRHRRVSRHVNISRGLQCHWPLLVDLGLESLPEAVIEFPSSCRRKERKRVKVRERKRERESKR